MYARGCRIRSWGLCLVAASLALAAACDDDEEKTDIGVRDARVGEGQVGDAAPTGRVLAVHASPDAPAVNLVIDDGAPVGPLSFPNATSYLAVPAGTRNVKVVPAAGGAAVITADLPVTAGASYTLFAANLLASIEPVVVSDDLTAPSAGKAKVRFAHMSPDAPAVKVLPQAGTALFENVSFKAVTPFVEVDAGTVTLVVQQQSNSAVVLSVPNVELQAGKIYTIWASGLLANIAAQTIVHNP